MIQDLNLSMIRVCKHKYSLYPKFPISAGIRERSILSPFFFNIFINDIPSNSFSYLALFADNIAFIASNDILKNFRHNFQDHLNNINKFPHKWETSGQSRKDSNNNFYS